MPRTILIIFAVRASPYWLYTWPDEPRGFVFILQYGTRVKGNLAFREKPTNHPSPCVGKQRVVFLGRGDITAQPWS